MKCYNITNPSVKQTNGGFAMWAAGIMCADVVPNWPVTLRPIAARASRDHGSVWARGHTRAGHGVRPYGIGSRGVGSGDHCGIGWRLVSFGRVRPACPRCAGPDAGGGLRSVPGMRGCGIRRYAAYGGGRAAGTDLPASLAMGHRRAGARAARDTPDRRAAPRTPHPDLNRAELRTAATCVPLTATSIRNLRL